MSVLPSILWFFVILQIVPQLLCDDTTIPPFESTNKSTEISANSSKSEATTGASSTTSSSVAPSAAPTTASTAETVKPTRSQIMHGAESVPSTPPPLLHNSGDAAAAPAAPAAPVTPAAPAASTTTTTTTTPKPTLKANTKSEKSAASFVNNPGVLTSLSVLLLICAIF